MKSAFAFALLLVLVSATFAQDPLLRPPKGAQAAIVVFEDLECPQCQRAAPLVKQASKNYKIPVVVHDFPLGAMHPWSTQAAVIAHYFDSQGKQTGLDFRDFIFQHQTEITPGNLQSYAEKFASDHKIALPFVLDPQGKLAAEVSADRNAGLRIGVHQTPTIYIVSAKGKPYIEVGELNQLFQTIEAIINQ